ncbi:MAG: LemA family protein [Clostridia bacterium]
MWWIPLIIVAVIIFFVIGLYNGLVRKKVYIGEAWSSIDVQLKRKANVIPNLIDTLKMQTNYEGDLLEKLTQARTGITSGSNTEKMKANDEISKMLPSFYAVAENYPTLGANESFRKLMVEVSDCEDKIAFSRNRYNMAVTDFNTELVKFPSNLMAKMLGYTEEPFFEISQEIRDTTDNMRIKDIS